MTHIETKTFGPHQVIDEHGQVLHEAWDMAEAERFLFELRADTARREAEDAAGHIFGL